MGYHKYKHLKYRKIKKPDEDIDDFKKRVKETLLAKNWINDDGSVDMDNIE